jgi:transcriptional regulator with XRE-family HTH domain
MNTPLKKHREKQGLTSREVAVALQIEPSHYRRVEIGEATPSAKLANSIAKHFGNAVTRDQILFPADYEEAPPRKQIRSNQLQKAS